MKKLFTLIIISFLFMQVGMAQSQKTFVKSLQADVSAIVVDLPGNAAVSEWDEKFVRITTTVEVTNFNEDILKRLVSVGRYELESSYDSGTMTIHMPKLAREVTIKGQLLIEVMTYEIQVPKGIAVEIATEEVTASGLN